MRSLFFLAVLLFSINNNHIFSNEEIESNKEIEQNLITETVFVHCEQSVLAVIDDKIYLNPNKFLCFKNHNLILKDNQEWMRLGEVFQDGFGFFIRAKEGLKCIEGHTAFKRVYGTWYCLEEGCKYYYFDHFN